MGKDWYTSGQSTWYNHRSIRRGIREGAAGGAALVCSPAGPLAAGVQGQDRLQVAPVEQPFFLGGAIGAVGGWLYSCANNKSYRLSEKLPKGGRGISTPELKNSYSQLGKKNVSKGPYRRNREIGEDGNHIRDIDFTDHGRPQNHTNPYQYEWLPNPTGGSSQHGPAKSL